MTSELKIKNNSFHSHYSSVTKFGSNKSQQKASMGQIENAKMLLQTQQKEEKRKNMQGLDLELTLNQISKPKTRNMRVFSSNCLREIAQQQSMVDLPFNQVGSNTRPVSAYKHEFQKSALLINNKCFVGTASGWSNTNVSNRLNSSSAAIPVLSNKSRRSLIFQKHNDFRNRLTNQIKQEIPQDITSLKCESYKFSFSKQNQLQKQNRPQTSKVGSNNRRQNASNLINHSAINLDGNRAIPTRPQTLSNFNGKRQQSQQKRKVQSGVFTQEVSEFSFPDHFDRIGQFPNSGEKPNKQDLKIDQIISNAEGLQGGNSFISNSNLIEIRKSPSQLYQKIGRFNPTDMKVTYFKYEQEFENFDQIKIITEPNEEESKEKNTIKLETQKQLEPIQVNLLEKSKSQVNDEIPVSKVLLNLMSRQSTKESQIFQNILSEDVVKLQEMTKQKKKQIEKQFKYLNENQFLSQKQEQQQDIIENYNYPITNDLQESEDLNIIKIMNKTQQRFTPEEFKQQNKIYQSNKNQKNYLKFEGATDRFIHSQSLSTKQRSRIQSAKLGRMMKTSQTPRNQILTSENFNSKLQQIRKYFGVEEDPNFLYMSSDKINLKTQTKNQKPKIIYPLQEKREKQSRLRKLQKLAQLKMQNDPSEKLKNLKKPKDHGICYVLLFQQINDILKNQSVDIATIFQNQQVEKLRLKKHYISAQGELLTQNNISDIDQFKHQIKSRQDKINFYQNQQLNGKLRIMSCEFCILIMNTDNKEELQLIKTEELMKDMFSSAEMNKNIIQIIPIHDIALFSDVKLIQVELTQIQSNPDEQMEGIINSLSDGVFSKDAENITTNTFDSKTTLKKNLTFDSQMVQMQISNVKIENCGKTQIVNIPNNKVENQDKLNTLSKFMIWQLIHKQMFYQLKQAKIVFLQENDGKLRLMNVYSILNDEQFKHHYLKEKLLFEINNAAKQSATEQPADKPSMTTHLLSEHAKRQLMDVGPISSSIQATESSCITATRRNDGSTSEPPENCYGEQRVRNGSIRRSIKLKKTESSISGYNKQLNQSGKLNLSGIKQDSNQRSIHDNHQQDKSQSSRRRRKQQQYQTEITSGSNTHLGNMRNSKYLQIDGTKVKMTGRSQSPNRLSIDHSKYLMDNNSSVNKNDIQTLNSPRYQKGKNDSATRQAKGSNPNLAVKSQKDLNIRDATNAVAKLQKAITGEGSQNEHRLSASGLSPTLQVRKLEAKSLQSPAPRSGSVTSIKDIFGEGEEEVAPEGAQNSKILGAQTWKQDPLAPDEQRMASYANQISGDYQDIQVMIISSPKLSSSKESFSISSRLQSNQQHLHQQGYSQGCQTRPLTSQATDLNEQVNIIAELTKQEERALVGNLAQCQYPSYNKITSYLHEFNCKYINKFQIYGTFQQKLSHVRGKLGTGLTKFRCQNVCCETIRLEIPNKIKNYDFFINKQLLEMVYLYFMRHHLTMADFRPPYLDHQFQQFIEFASEGELPNGRARKSQKQASLKRSQLLREFFASARQDVTNEIDLNTYFNSKKQSLENEQIASLNAPQSVTSQEGNVHRDTEISASLNLPNPSYLKSNNHKSQEPLSRQSIPLRNNSSVRSPFDGEETLSARDYEEKLHPQHTTLVPTNKSEKSSAREQVRKIRSSKILSSSKDEEQAMPTNIAQQAGAIPEHNFESMKNNDYGMVQDRSSGIANNLINQQTQAIQTATPQGRDVINTPDANAYFIQQQKIAKMEQVFVTKMRNLTPQQSFSRLLFNKSRAQSSDSSLYGLRERNKSRKSSIKWLQVCPKCLQFMISFLQMSELTSN